MIKSVINTFREQARSHKSIQSFYYNRTYELGSGNENYPLFWLEDPLTGQNRGNIFSGTVNFSVLFIPDNKQQILHYQNLAFSIGLNIIERIKQNESAPIKIQPSWTYITLREYYDNDACGCRFSVDFTHPNMQNLCLIDEQFDDSKEFDTRTTLIHFDLTGNDGQEVYSTKLPVFDLKTTKR